MKRTGLLIVILLIATTQPSAQARQTETGSGIGLLQTCRLYFEFLGRTGAGQEETFEQDPFGMGYCAGLVRGTANMAVSLMPNRVCLPAGTTAAQAVWVIVQYLEDNPQTLPEPDTELVLRALEGAYRCP